jgi:hypothetical protein
LTDAARVYGPRFHRRGMFVVSEAEAAAIRAAFERGGEFFAAVELRRLFPGVTDNVQARECGPTIAAWKPLPVKTRLARLLSKGAVACDADLPARLTRARAEDGPPAWPRPSNDAVWKLAS